ncbi:MAG: DUF3396 domain-containing protein [Deltaproteobacteria bacterium]|nr:DUF3396 domain-containing protein [Deltaproteobacteria bacterium]
MGFNVGGMYVRARAGVDRDAVVEAIRAHWQKLGASHVNHGDVLLPDPLSLAQTGSLSFAVSEARPGSEGAKWIAVADSERYTADPALAAALASVLSTEVWLYVLTETNNSGRARRFGAKPQVLRKSSEVEALVASMPFSFFYFDDLKAASAAKRKPWTCFGFEGVPHRPKADYSGPSRKQLAEQRAAAVAGSRGPALLAARDAKGLSAISDGDGIWELVERHVEAMNLREPENVRFAHALAPAFMGRSYATNFWKFVDATLRAGDDALARSALSRIENARYVAKGESFALALAEQGEVVPALRMLEWLTRSEWPSATIWGNAVRFLVEADRTTLPARRVTALLKGARASAPVNVAALHYLAIAYVRSGQLEAALSCVRDAVKLGYDQLEALRADPGLAPLRKRRELKAAFAEKVARSPAHLVIERGAAGKKLRLIGPAIGFHLYFANSRSAPALGELVEQLATEFPDMFAFWVPQDGLPPRKTPKGRPARDISALRKNKATYGFEIHYDAEGASACQQRLFIELSKQGGELTLHLPLKLADEPDALAERVIGYARTLPFVSGSAGFTLSSYHRGSRVSSTDAGEARRELRRLLPTYLGLTASQSHLGSRVLPTILWPSWLTFLGAPLTKQLGPRFAKVVSPCQLIDLGPRGWVLRASRAPALSAASDAPALGALAHVARELSRKLPAVGSSEDPFIVSAAERCEALGRLAASRATSVAIDA